MGAYIYTVVLAVAYSFCCYINSSKKNAQGETVNLYRELSFS